MESYHSSGFGPLWWIWKGDGSGLRIVGQRDKVESCRIEESKAVRNPLRGKEGQDNVAAKKELIYDGHGYSRPVRGGR